MHWNAIYERRSEKSLSWFQTHPEVSLELIDGLELPPSSRVVDVGGGASSLVDHLLTLGHGVCVVDVSSRALDMSRNRLSERAEWVEWLVGDITTVELEGHYSLWHDRAVFHFLTEASDRATYVERMRAALIDGGHAIIATFALDGPERCSGLPIIRYSPETLARELGDDFGLIGIRRETHNTPAGDDQSFVYCVFRHVKSGRPCATKGPEPDDDYQQMGDRS